MRRAGFFLGALGLLCVFISCDGARGGYSENACYFCTDTGSNPDCRDYDLLFNANLKNNDTEQILLRNCSSDQPYCMIELYVKLGQVYSYIRDCTSNRSDSFSFAMEGRLKHVSPNNVTTSNGIECYKCESTVGGSDCDALYNVTADTREQEFGRNCTGVGDFCVIETFTQHKTDMYSVIRDCSDNTTYSFNISFPLNLHLPPKPKDVAENRTKCVRVYKRVDEEQMKMVSSILTSKKPRTEEVRCKEEHKASTPEDDSSDPEENGKGRRRCRRFQFINCSVQKL
ncbi:uncharacterized protein LOC124287288 [Haliotis rubra]|uniref:uncharacterized protein LOC124287288 n=1 Tax=Haliotis rubra TaxID=36100 RepID=UPI001EE55812|nr:uncharacterized protein LOC124287288 [Haliotis rubra]